MYCSLCQLYTHCPTPALRAQEDYDYRACAFFRHLTRSEYSEKLGREWAQAGEAAAYIHSREVNDRYEQRLRDQGRPRWGTKGAIV